MLIIFFKDSYSLVYFLDLIYEFISGDFHSKIGQLGDTAFEFLEHTSISLLNRDLVSEMRGRIPLEFMCFYGFTLFNGRSFSDSPG